jgi:energy-coupling factor transport system substrate-specific component
MLDIVKMWKQPKMVAYTILTALLYPALIYPFQNFTVFAGHADYFRVGMGIPIAFSFLFGPAAAWGTAFGNLIYDVSTDGVRWISLFGFIGNFLIAYLPYKLWSALTAEKPNLRSIKKLGLFVGLTFLACAVCGLIIGWGLLLLYSSPFQTTAFMIATTDALWGLILGSVILAFSYEYLSIKKLLYTDILHINVKPSWNMTKTFAVAVFALSTVLSLVVSNLYAVSLFMLLPFVVLSVIAVLIPCWNSTN